MGPNVVLLVLDAARADHFEPYGAPAGSTPALRDIAASGGFAEHAFAAASWTIPSHAALFSGLPPRAIGLSKVPGSTPMSCRPPLEAARDRLLAPFLQRQGYETAAVSTNAWLLPGSGFDIGFEQFELVPPSRTLKLESESRRERLSATLEVIRSRVDDGGARALGVLGQWATRPQQKPFFWFVNLVEAHSPYLPPKPFNSLGPLERLRSLADARRYQTMDAIWRSSLGHLSIPEEAFDRMRRLYRDSIRLLDKWIGDLLEVLDTNGKLAETLVVVTSDHGDNLGESGMLGHSFSLDDRLLRVPLIFSGPSALPPSGVTSLADVPRLIADALGLADHPWTARAFPEGTAVAQFDPPVPADDPRVEEVLDLWALTAEAIPGFTSRLTAATDARHKLVRRGDAEEFYNLATDPLEVRPIEPAAFPEPAVVARLRAAIGASDALAEPSAQAGATPVDGGAEVPDDLEERMRLLGYL